jgi:serine protease Do
MPSLRPPRLPRPVHSPAALPLPGRLLPALLALLCVALAGTPAGGAQPARPAQPGAGAPAAPATPPATAPATPPGGSMSAATLEELAEAVVGITAEIPADARTAGILGTHREGSGIVIDPDGRIVTIGYLVLEAGEVSVTRYDGRTVAARVLGYDEDSGLALVQSDKPLELRPLALGDSGRLAVSDPVLILTRGGIEDAHTAQVVSRRTFAAYWEYLLERAIFTAPPRRDYAGAALLDQQLRLVGVGSLLVQNAAGPDVELPGNLFVPINRLKPVLADLIATGRPGGKPRPWLGISVAEQFGRVLVTRVTQGGPASEAGLQPGDLILEVAGHKVQGLEDFYRQLWALGPAGVAVPLRLLQRAELVRIAVHSGDRYAHYHLTLRP